MTFMVAVGWLAGLLSFSQPSLPSPSASSQIPVRAVKFQRSFTSNVRFVWGINAPIATMAGQIHQESAWRADAKSPYANGIAQFTPDTAEWISSIYPDLAANNPFEPEWGFRALARYDKYLYDRQTQTSSQCDRWAFTLSAYNGGEGWVTRDKLLAKSKGKDPTKWFGHVELYSNRAAWAKAENRTYPKRILLTHQHVYTNWGPKIECN